MKDNDNNTFKVRYQTENNEDTGDYKDDNDDDELTIIPTDIAFLGDYIYVTRDLSAASGYFYEGFPVYWNQPFYAWNQPYFGWNQTYSYGWNQPSYGWNQPYYGYQQSYNFYGYPWADQPPYGYSPWYYQPPTLANDFGGYPFGYQQTYNYGFGPSIGPGYPGYGFVGYPYGYGSAPYPYY